MTQRTDEQHQPGTVLTLALEHHRTPVPRRRPGVDGGRRVPDAPRPQAEHLCARARLRGRPCGAGADPGRRRRRGGRRAHHDMDGSPQCAVAADQPERGSGGQDEVEPLRGAAVRGCQLQPRAGGLSRRESGHGHDRPGEQTGRDGQPAGRRRPDTGGHPQIQQGGPACRRPAGGDCDGQPVQARAQQHRDEREDQRSSSSQRQPGTSGDPDEQVQNTRGHEGNQDRPGRARAHASGSGTVATSSATSAWPRRRPLPAAASASTSR